MKLLVIGTDTSIFRPGSEARSRIGEYARLFDEFHVVIYTSPGFLAETTASGAKIYPTNSRLAIFRPFDAARIGRRIVRERGIDVVSVQDPAESGLAGWLVKRSSGALLHIQLHTDILSPYFRKNSWKEMARWLLGRFIIGRGDYFRAVSRRVADSLSSVMGVAETRIAILPVFVDREAMAMAVVEPSSLIRERYQEFDFIVLMVSRLNRDKRIDVALNAFRRLCLEFPKTGLVIAGDGPERGALWRLSRKLGISGSVIFTGWKEDLASCYKGADLYLLTSAFEGYGRSIIEAAAAGIPVVMTDVGVAGDIIRERETGRVVPVGDAQALLGAMTEARRDYPAMVTMAARAQEAVLAASPRTKEEYLRLYKKSYEDFLYN